MPYRLTTFGTPSLVDDDGDTPAGLGPGKPLAVLCYLAREGEVRRERITALLWGETTESKARNAFRQALHRLRSALGEELVPHDPDTIRIAVDADLRVDAVEFERALAEGRPEDAVELVAGDFLEGFTVHEPGFDHWADGERARLRGRYLAALRDAAARALAGGHVDEAVHFAGRLAKEDPLDSTAAVLEARTLTAAGRAEEARRLLKEHADRYRDQVGDEPPEEVDEALTGLEEGETDAAADDVARDELVLHPDALARLTAAWRGTVDGEAGVARLEGASGSGKTWLIDELIRRVRPLDRPMVLRGAVRMGRHGLPFAPVAEALRGVLRARGLAGASTHLLGEAARLLPELRDRFDLPVPGPITDETGRLRFFEGVASVLDAVAYEQPVLMVLEGLHEADGPTVELIHFLASRLGDSPILFLLASDGTGGARELAERFDGRAERVDLGPVGDDALDLFLEARAPDLGPMARAEVAAASAGSPGKALELARRRARGEPIGGVPARMDDVIRGRLAGRTPRERRILLVLALVPRPLPVRLVAAATHLPEGSVLESIDPLRAAGLIRERDHGIQLPDGPTRALVLESVGGAGRGLLAGWTAEALAAERAASDAELASLAAEAGRLEEAARYAEMAGRTAAQVGATELAAEHYRRAVGWVGDRDPEARGRLERALAALGGGARRLGAGAEAETGAGAGAGSGAGAGAGARAGDSGHGSRTRTRARALWAATAVAAVISAILVFWVPGQGVEGPGPVERTVRDTLVLVRTDPDGGRTRLGFTGDRETALERRPLVMREQPAPRWVDSLTAAGLPVVASPDGERFAVAVGDRRSPTADRRFGAGQGGVRGDSAYLAVVSADRADTAFIAAAAPDAVLTPLAWAPDGSRLLYGVDAGTSGLWAGPVAGAVSGALAVDTTGAAIDEAAWSPDGTRVAWTARRADGSRDVWVAFADGTAPRRLTNEASDAYNIDWSPSGGRVAFTSDRSGNADIFAVEVASGRLWRLTWNAAHDDRAAFSPDGEYVAFESTRGGEAAVYVMSSWGGQPVRVTGAGQRIRHDGWRGYPPPHLSHLRFRMPRPLAVGERAQLVVEPIHSDYVARHRGSIRWRALDPAVVALAEDGPGERIPEAAAADTFVAAVGDGLGRVAVSAGGWREDTVFVKVGSGTVAFTGDDAARGSFPVDYGLRVDGTLSAGEVALVAPREDGGDVDGAGPVRVASLRRSADGRVAFQVEREEHIVAVDGDGGPAEFAIIVGEDGRVAFEVGAAVRWQSTLRVTGTGLPVHRVRVWVEGGAEVGRVEVGGI